MTRGYSELASEAVSAASGVDYAAHGFVFQHHGEFAADVDAFRTDAS